MPWVTRGLRNGIVTSRYPRRPDDYGHSFGASVTVVPPARAESLYSADGADLAGLCPTGAITDQDRRLRVDQGRCILCGRCVAARPDLFRLDPLPQNATLTRRQLVVPDGGDESDEALAALRAELYRRVRALRRSVHIRHVDAGSDGSEEWEIAALNNPVYDIQRLGMFFTASPRHADVLLVSGAGSAGMAGPLRHTWEVMPEPRVVVAVGVDAISGGLIHPTYATRGGISDMVPVDVWVPGSPPSPFAILHGLLLAVGLVSGEIPQ
jgi:Ni,Fe-hydrogenase III small subunit/ferredoxin